MGFVRSRYLALHLQLVIINQLLSPLLFALQSGLVRLNAHLIG
jgi:hypothetical protein